MFKPVIFAIAMRQDGTQGFMHCSDPLHIHHTSPCMPSLNAGVQIVGATARRYNTYVLDARGVLYAWGLDGCASEGVVPPKEEAWKSRSIKGELAAKKVVAVDAGGVQDRPRRATGLGDVGPMATGPEGVSSQLAATRTLPTV